MTSHSLFHKLDSLPPILKEQAISFIDSLVVKSQESKYQPKPKPVFGCMKGKITLSSDFDEPLDEFKDYM